MRWIDRRRHTVGDMGLDQAEAFVRARSTGGMCVCKEVHLGG